MDEFKRVVPNAIDMLKLRFGIVPTLIDCSFQFSSSLQTVLRRYDMYFDNYMWLKSEINFAAYVQSRNTLNI